MRKTGDETRRRRAMASAFGEHLVQRAPRQPALQRRVRTGMAERHARKRIRLAFEAADGPPQGRKRTHARAQHAPLLTVRFVTHLKWVMRSFVHDMF
jgi:hypothetical protein